MEINGVEMYSRRCDITGLGLNSGYKVGDRYACNQESADVLAQDEGFEDYTEMYDCYQEMEGDDTIDYCYWTEWEVEAEGELLSALYDVEGNEYLFIDCEWNMVMPEALEIDININKQDKNGMDK